MTNTKKERKTIGRAALTLAMTENRQEEEQVKELLIANGYKAVATEVSGPLIEFKQKIIKNAVTAAIQTNVLVNDAKSLHALVHAVSEALQGILISHLANPSIKVKLGIISDGNWIAVGIFGVAALSVFTNHERAGLGIMHL